MVATSFFCLSLSLIDTKDLKYVVEKGSSQSDTTIIGLWGCVKITQSNLGRSNATPIELVWTFWETNKIWKNLPHSFDKSADLLIKRQNHEGDFFKLCLLLKKSNFYYLKTNRKKFEWQNSFLLSYSHEIVIFGHTPQLIALSLFPILSTT